MITKTQKRRKSEVHARKVKAQIARRSERLRKQRILMATLEG
jgi:hypothetical protein